MIERRRENKSIGDYNNAYLLSTAVTIRTDGHGQDDSFRLSTGRRRRRRRHEHVRNAYASSRAPRWRLTDEYGRTRQLVWCHGDER